MSEALDPFGDGYVPRLFTAADLAAMPADVPSGTVRWELHRGRLLALRPVDWWHSRAASNVAVALHQQASEFGKTGCGGVGVILARKPDHVLGADVIFVRDERLPIRCSPEDYLETIPDFIVEVAAWGESPSFLRQRTVDYLAAGVAVVWEVYPSCREIHEHRPGRTTCFRDGDTLSLADLIPEFALAVSDVFGE